MRHDIRLGGSYDQVVECVEGVLRGHRVDPRGEISDTAYFSVLLPEWPQVRLGLLKPLALVTMPDVPD